MTLSISAVAAFLSTAEQARRALESSVEEIWRGHYPDWMNMSSPEPAVVEADGAIRLDLTTRLHSGGAAEPEYVVEFRLTVEVAEAGFRIVSDVEARLEHAMGDLPPGTHVLVRQSSETLGLEAALVELLARAEAFYDVHAVMARLGRH